MQYADSDIRVATADHTGVVKFYGVMGDNGVRPFLWKEELNNYGQAVLRASEFLEGERKAKGLRR